MPYHCMYKPFVILKGLVPLMLFRTLGVALQDLQALMSMAGDMVKLAERFRGVMAQVGGPVSVIW